MAAKATVESLKHDAVHTYALVPGGQEVKQKGAALSQLIRGGRIPNPWAEMAVKVEYSPDGLKVETLSIEDIQAFESFRDWLIAETLVSPKLTPDQVSELNGLHRRQMWNVALHGFDDMDGVASFLAAARSVAAWGNGKAEEPAAK